MKKTTPFYEAAIRFAENRAETFGCCTELDAITGNIFSKEQIFFTERFEPTYSERQHLWKRFTLFWMENDQDRIIALLFADLLWQDLNN